MSEATASSGIAPGPGLLGILSDDRLARRAVNGDERAFAAIFRRYHQSLYRFCLAIVGDPQDAQDALQNTMVKVLRALPGEERRIELKPWLYRIAHNESIDLLRRRRETRELDAELPSRGPGLAEEAAARERLRRLFADLEELPERQRETLVMRELAGLDFAEIGAALGTTAAVARQTVYEARLSLRQMDEGREMSCEAVSRALSDGDGRVIRRRDVRAHLRTCACCRRFQRGNQGTAEGLRRDLAAAGGRRGRAPAGPARLGERRQRRRARRRARRRGGQVDRRLGGAQRGGHGRRRRRGRRHRGGPRRARRHAAARRRRLLAGRPGRRVPRPGGRPPAPPAPKERPACGRRRRSMQAPAPLRRRRPAPGRRAAGEARGAGTTAAGDSSPGTPASAHGNGRASEHPHGRGHEKRHPAASGHGQQTAAAHQGGKHGAAGAKGGSSQPANPPHPAHPANPGGEKGASASPPKSGATAPAEVGEQAAPVTPPPVEEDIAGPGQRRNP